MIGDLHCHTKLSDGSLGIEDNIVIAKRYGLDFLSITDHDTLAGITRAKVLGTRYGVHIIPGVEFSCIDPVRNRKVHILCYLSDKPDRLEGLCHSTCENRKAVGRNMIAKVMDLYPVTKEQIAKYTLGCESIYKQHIMHVLMDMGYTTSIYGDLFRKLFDPKTGLVYEEPEYPDVREVCKLIWLSKGIPVLAHPSVYQSMELLEELAAEKYIEGVELWHPRNTPEDIRRIEEIAVENGLLCTGGSDFHGMYGSQAVPMGTCTTPHESLGKLFAIKDKR